MLATAGVTSLECVVSASLALSGHERRPRPNANLLDLGRDSARDCRSPMDAATGAGGGRYQLKCFGTLTTISTTCRQSAADRPISIGSPPVQGSRR